MAVTTNNFSSGDNVPRDGMPYQWAFTATKHDTNFLEDPDNADVAVCSKGISLDINTDAVSVVFAKDSRTYAFPAGSLAAGVIHPINIVRVNSTGTGGTVVVTIHM